MKLLALLGNIFVIIMMFGLLTNGLRRKDIVKLGYLGFLVMFIFNIIMSIYLKDLYVITFVYENIFVAMISGLVFRLIFRKINSPPIWRCFLAH